MKDRKLTVTEAARHFADLVNRTYYCGETTVLYRSGEPVAMMVPVGGAAKTGRDWLARWENFPHLDAADADDFAASIEEAKGDLTPATSPWD